MQAGRGIPAGHRRLAAVILMATGGAKHPAGAAEPSDPQAGTPLRDVLVLVVEDESFVAMDLAATLQDLGARVVGTAASRPEALALARAHRPQLAIVDIRLKDGETGVDAAQEMANLLGVAIVFATAHTDPGLVARMARVPGAARLFKPYDAMALESAARQVLRRQ